MATNSPPSLKRKRDSEPAPAPTSLMSLGDDMLAEILRRLPSLPSLASAALASPRLCGVASSSAVFNCFLSRASLLGYFVSVTGGAVPIFYRALLRGERHLAAIVRRSDFHLPDFDAYEWRLMDCRHGLLLLMNDNHHLVVFDPVSRSRLRITDESITSNSFHCFLPACSGDIDGGTTSFRVLSLGNGGGRVRAHVYSSRTAEWRSHSPAPKGIMTPTRGGQPYLQWSTHAGGRIYWKSRTGGPLTSLDVGSMEFAHVALPEKLDCGPRSYAVGDTEDGTTCLVAISDVYVAGDRKLVLQVWFRKESDNSWELQCKMDDSKWDMVSYGRRRVEKVCNVTAGVVLVCMAMKYDVGLHYLAFRLKNLSAIQDGTTKLQLEADFFTSDGWVHPYFMAWPRPTLKASTSENNAATRGQEAGGSKRKKTRLKDQEADSSKKN